MLESFKISAPTGAVAVAVETILNAGVQTHVYLMENGQRASLKSYKTTVRIGPLLTARSEVPEAACQTL